MTCLTPVLLLDSEGNRILAKYFQPPQETISEHPPTAPVTPGLGALGARNPYPTHKEQRALEHAVWDKARRASGDLFQYDGNLVLFKSSYDVYFFVIAPERENELMMHSSMMSLYEALSVLLQSQIDKRTVLDNLDLVTLAIDESVDDGYVGRLTVQHHSRDGQRGDREPRHAAAARLDRGADHRAEYVAASHSHHERLRELPRPVRAAPLGSVG